MKILKMLVEITIDAFRSIMIFFEDNLMKFVNILNVLFPYAMLFYGQYIGDTRGISVGWEILIPLVFAIIVYYLKSVANKIGKGITIPLPSKRFTEVDDDGEVSIENKRIQELLLYMADLEDWLEKKGLL